MRSREHLAQEAAATTVSLRTGWNPVAFQSPRLTSLSAPPAVQGMASYEGGAYRIGPVTAAEASGRRGFWVYSQGEASMTYDGGSDGQGNRVTVGSGWNLVSFATTQSVAVNRLQGAGETLIYQVRVDGTSAPVEVIQPGLPCWIFANGPTTITWEEPAAVALEVTPADLTLARFAISQLTATARFADGTRRDVTSLVAWTSSVPSAGAVSSTGVVTALQAGTVELTATLDGLSARTRLTVTDAGTPGPLPIPSPALTALAPVSGPAAGGTAVTLTGTGLTGATAVRFGATAATTFTVNSDSQITATAPTGTGAVQVTVTTPGGVSGGQTFTYIPLPALTSIAPLFGASGITVTLTGTDLTGATAVSFGGTAATSFTPVSATQVDAVVPAGTGGSTVAVTVTTAGGTSNSVNFGYDLVLGAGTHTFNTTTGILDGAAAAHPAWDGTRLALPGSFTLTGTLTVNGTQPFEVTSPGNIAINNTLDATGKLGGHGILTMAFSGIGGLGGPGGGAGGSRGGYMNNPANAAAGGAGAGPGGGGGGAVLCRPGGGGGHAAAGQAGQGVTPGEGAAGAAYTSIPTLRLGGSGGGAGGTGTTVNSFCGGGGGGGGVVILTAAGTLTATGTIDCRGGRGGDGTGPAPADTEANAGAPGGGGSGGSILLTGVPVPTVPLGQLLVGGGAGGTSGNFPGPPLGVLPARVGGAGSAGRVVQQ